jgi:hypothetical protein
MPDGHTRLVVINKDARQKLQLALPSGKSAKVWRLQAPDLAATKDVTLAGAEIQPGKTWKPGREETLASANGEVRLDIEPAAAAALFFQGRL